MMKFNQRKIAELAQVSYATVSRALSGGNVSAKMKDRIENAMQQLGYNMHTEQTCSNLVMVIAGNIAESFFANIIRGICDQLQISGFYPVVCNSNFNGETEEEYIRTANMLSYAGIIMITAVESPSLVSLTRSLRIPLIFVNRYIRSLNFDEVCVDNYRGAYIATEYLISHGHRRIAHLAGPEYSSATQDRLKGYQNALQDAGFDTPAYYIIRGDLSPESGYNNARAICDPAHSFTAVFVANAQMSFGMLNYFYEHNIRVPEDISVICHDELPQITDGPLRITTVSYDPYPLGVEAVNVLIRRVQERETERMRIFYSPHLTERGSVKKAYD